MGYEITERADGKFDVSHNGVVFSTKISRDWAEREIARAAADVAADIEYQASPEYAAKIKSWQPSASELSAAIHHFMHEQGDLA